MGDVQLIPAAAEYFDLGSYTFPVTTDNPDCQKWFDRGLVWCYGFNHEEATTCFEQAIAHDPKCAMAYWGLSFSLGPNYNKPWHIFQKVELTVSVARARQAAARANELLTDNNISVAERVLIVALEARYPEEEPVQDDEDQQPDRKLWNKKYAEAMAVAYAQCPDHLDVAALNADALMNLTPWKLWDIHTKAPVPGAPTELVVEILNRSLALPGASSHPGLLHLYIHLMEMSPTPEAALEAANNLRSLVPDAGHLRHMPSHLDVLCGDYQSAISSNMDAYLADNKFFLKRGDLNFYTLYRAHDLHFRLYAAMLAGQSAVAMETVSLLEKIITPEVLQLEVPPMADYLESFLAMRFHALIRFGKWEEILAIEPPEDPGLFCVTATMIRYARGVALAALGRPEEADVERELFGIMVTIVPKSRVLLNNFAIDILAVAEAVLNAEVEYRMGHHLDAFIYLNTARDLEAHLPYNEPWGWMQPIRHIQGALYLEQGRVSEALAAYAEDLGYPATHEDSKPVPRQLQHPHNVWALHGYHESLVKLGRVEEAKEAEGKLKVALEGADVTVRASCYCRTVY